MSIPSSASLVLSGRGCAGSGLYTVLGRAGSFSPSYLARPSLCALEPLRGTLGGETMTTVGGAGTTLANTRSLFPCSAHRLLSWVGAPWSTWLRPFACPGPISQGVSYVQVSGLGAYIRNIIPIRAPAGLSRVQSKPLPGRARTLHPPARPDLFSPNVGVQVFCEVELPLYGVLGSSL
jgi:hypothetical protein